MWYQRHSTFDAPAADLALVQALLIGAHIPPTWFVRWRSLRGGMAGAGQHRTYAARLIRHEVLSYRCQVVIVELDGAKATVPRFLVLLKGLAGVTYTHIYAIHEKPCRITSLVWQMQPPTLVVGHSLALRTENSGAHAASNAELLEVSPRIVGQNIAICTQWSIISSSGSWSFTAITRCMS